MNSESRWRRCSRPNCLTSFLGGEIKQAVITEQEHFWVIIVVFFSRHDRYFPLIPLSTHPSIHPSAHPSIPAGALEETKDRGYSVLRGGSPPFFIWREDTSLIISPVTATNYCWLPGSASTSPRMNGQTQASLSLFFTRLSSRCLFLFLLILPPPDIEVARPDTQPLVRTPSLDGRRFELRLIHVLDFENQEFHWEGFHSGLGVRKWT